jgi:hypothetical protein
LFESLPAGPLSGAHVRVWQAAAGRLRHGDRDCRSLQRSFPSSQEHPLGDGTTLGDLNWPVDLHCVPSWTDDPAGRYLRDARRLAADLEQAERMAVAAEAVVGPLEWGRAGSQADAWNWPALAALAATVAGAGQPHPEDRRLQALAEQAAGRLRRLDRRVRDMFDSHPWVAPDARQGRQLLHRACAAQVVLGHYDSRSPGPLWTAYQNHGWSAAHAVVLAANPDAELQRSAELSIAVRALESGRPRSADYLEELAAAQCRDVVSPLEEALLRHGQESWTYHRLWELTGPESGSSWTDGFEHWANGTSFGGWGQLNTYHRRRLLWPELLPAALPALAAAEAAWMAFLDGIAAGGRQPTLCVLRPPTAHVDSFAGCWLPDALAVAHPSAAVLRVAPIAATDPHRLLIVVVPEVAAWAVASAAWPPVLMRLLDGEEASFPQVCVAVASEIGRSSATGDDERLTAAVDRVLAGSPD